MTLTGVAAVTAATSIHAEWDFSVEWEGRWFEQAPAYPGQARNDSALRLKGRYTREWGDGNDFFTFSPILRLDAVDASRTALDIDELGWTHLMEHSELRLGLRKLFWGVAESNHLVDIINQTDLVDNPDGESKLAQPMVNLALFTDAGTFDLFVLPGFRERTFPGERGRFRGPIPVGDAEFEADQGRSHIDLAGRWSRTLDTADIGISLFHGTSREPNLITTADGRRIARYPLIDQVGIDLQLIADAWIWKLEAIGRRGENQSFQAAVGGFEYTFYAVGSTPADATLFVEYSRDERGAGSPFGFDNDLFLGLRTSFNDSAGSQLMVGVTKDLDGERSGWSKDKGASARAGW